MPPDPTLYRLIAEIGEKVGALSATVEAIGEAAERRENKIDAIGQHVAGLLDLPGRVEQVERGVQEFRDLKNRGLGALAMAGLLGGGAATGIIAFVEKWFGGPAS
jgi:hypothetical protein